MKLPLPSSATPNSPTLIKAPGPFTKISQLDDLIPMQGQPSPIPE